MKRTLLRLVGLEPDNPLLEELLNLLVDEVAPMQNHAMLLQSQRIPYEEIVVPLRFESVVDEGMTFLGRRLVAADVDRLGFFTAPPRGLG